MGKRQFMTYAEYKNNSFFGRLRSLYDRKFRLEDYKLNRLVNRTIKEYNKSQKNETTPNCRNTDIGIAGL
jgi:hypothetical protein